jgi:CheY-like chemotaxis protein
LIFIDVQMPERDGFEATATIRTFEREHSRPPCYIVAMTASSSQLSARSQPERELKTESCQLAALSNSHRRQ